MRRLALLLVLAVAVAVPASAAADNRHPTLASLEGKIMCPTCHTTLDQSNAPVAQRIKQFISARIAAGDTESQIKAKLVAQFGPAVLASPPKHGFNLLAWLLPPAGILLAGGVLGVLAWRWSRSRESAPAAAPEPALEPELERQLEEELAKFDA